jgi:hypothetical protein
MRWLSMRRRLPVRRRVRLAWLRRLWLRRLWVLLAVGPLPHLLKRTTFKFGGQKRVFVAGLILDRAGHFVLFLHFVFVRGFVAFAVNGWAARLCARA